MKGLFKRLVRLGVTSNLPRDLTDEIKVINAIKIQGLVLVWITGTIMVTLLPQHSIFLISLMLVHLLAAIAVLSFNARHKYSLAKWIFVTDPILLLVALSAYFGVDSNFHYITLLSFFMFIILFRRNNGENLSLILTFMGLSLGGILVVYLSDYSYAKLNDQELQQMRFAVYSLSVALAVMMGIVLQRNARNRLVKAEETLRVSERDATILQTISDNMDEAIFQSSIQEGFKFVNDAFARMYGYSSKEEILAIHPVNLYQSKQERDALLARIEKYGKVTNMLLKYRKKDGSEFWGRLSCTRLEEEDGPYLVGTIADVTAQQEQTEKLQNSERQLRDSQRLAKMGNWVIFPQRSQRVEWSGECAHIHGFLPMDYEDSLNIWLKGIHDITRQELGAAIARSTMMNTAFEFGSWYTTPAGEQKYLYYICQQGEADEEVIWYGTVQDRTELKNQEQELIATREFYQNVLDNIPVEPVLIDENLKYFYISKNAIQHDDLRQKMIGKTNADYAAYKNLDPAFALLRDDMIAKAMTGDLTVRWEEKMITPDGRDTYHIRNLVPVWLKDGRNVKKFLIGYSFDINDIKRAQFRLEDRNEELNQLNKELDRFVYSISHDLRAPIASVLGLNSLAEESEDREELNNILVMQREALDRLDRYIRDVIDYSRNKRLDVRAEHVEIAKVVDDCLADLVYMANYEQIDYFIEVPEKLSVFSDALRIKIIINNLLSNAIKYADAAKGNSYISVRAEKKDEGILLVIEDNGIGIKEEFMDHIWDIFFRGTSSIPGSGLGLYILKESVNNINGTVKLESKEGEFTRFEVYLPGLDR